MRVLIDTNVALTYVSGREEPFSNEVDAIMRKCAKEEIEGALAFHSLSTIWYQTRKLPEAIRRDWILFRTGSEQLQHKYFGKRGA